MSASAIRLLVVEDEAHLGAILGQFLAGRGCAVTRVGDARSALAALAEAIFDVVLLDLVLPGGDGLVILDAVRRDLLPPEVILMSGNAGAEVTAQAFSRGAYDVVPKPYRLTEVDGLVRRAFEKRLLARACSAWGAPLALGPSGLPSVVTGDAALRAALSLAQQGVASAGALLVHGAPGSGKAHVARALHAACGRASAPFVEVDAARGRADDVAEWLLGVEPGGAPAEPGQVGCLEAAAGGTVLLRHVECLPGAVQRELAEALERGTFTRVGGRRRVPLEAVVMAATTMPAGISAVAASGTAAHPAAHPALLHALGAVRLQLPALRDRAGDIPLLARHFVAESRHHPARHGDAFTDAAIDRLERHDWPGQVRELRDVVLAAAARAAGRRIDVGDLVLRTAPADEPLVPLAELERRRVADVLAHTGWHQGRAADLLGISPKTLYRKIREFGLQRPRRGRGAVPAPRAVAAAPERA